MIAVGVIPLLLLLASADAATSVCGRAFNGTYVDLSALGKTSVGAYLLVNNTGIVDAAHGFPNPQPVATYEINVCGNVASSFASCTTPSPVNRINITTGECTPLGDITTTAWDLNPEGGGVYVTYYHGASIDRVYQYSTRIYFECDPSVEAADTQIIFEHETDRGQFHFIAMTKYACSATFTGSSSSSSSSTSTTTTTGGNTNAPSIKCGREFNGTVLDLSALFATNGSYLNANTPGNAFPPYGPQPLVSAELQICGNLISSYSSCTVPSPANIVNATSGECIYAGDITTAAWDINPELDGINLVYFHGQLNGRVYQRSTRVYFICNPSVDIAQSQFTYEHVTSLDEYHWFVQTKLACPSYYSSTSTSTSTLTGKGSTAHTISPFYALAAVIILVLTIVQ